VEAPVLCLLETPEEQQPWCLCREQMAPCKHASWPEMGASLESSPKACYKDMAVSGFGNLLSQGCFFSLLLPSIVSLILIVSKIVNAF